MLNRRGFLSLLGGGIVCAPAIVRAASIMPVRAIIPTIEPIFADGDLLYRGVIIRDVSNTFAPIRWIGREEAEDLYPSAWVDTAKAA